MTVVRVYEDFKNLPQAYTELFQKAEGRDGFFLGASWFANLEQSVLCNEGRLRLYGVESGAPAQTALTALPLFCPDHHGRFGMRKLSGYANYYTSLFGPLRSETDAHATEHWSLIANAIARETPHWHMVDLHPLDRDSTSFQQAVDALRNAGMLVQPYFCFGNWYLSVNGRSFADYFKTLSGPLKNTIKRKSAQIKKTATLKISILSTMADVEEGTRAFTSVYQSSWKNPEPYDKFIPGLIRSCAENGSLRLGVAYLDGLPVASQLWIVSAGIASIYKLAYDERVGRLSIGSILTAALMEHVIDVDRVREVDYLTGDEPYKKDWMSHRRERWGIVAFNQRTLRGTLAAAWHIGGQTLRRLVKGQ